VLLHARGAEIVGDAADGDHQGVVPDRAHRRDETAVLVELGGEVHQAMGAVEADHLAQPKPEAMPIGLREIVELVAGNVHAAGRDFVEQRFPQMGARLLHQGDVGAAGPTERIAEARDEFDPTGTAADHDDAMQVVARHDGAMRVVARRGFRRQLICRRARHRWSPLSAGPGIIGRVTQCRRHNGCLVVSHIPAGMDAAPDSRRLPT
jgi:hypothetical protein